MDHVLNLLRLRRRLMVHNVRVGLRRVRLVDHLRWLRRSSRGRRRRLYDVLHGRLLLLLHLHLHLHRLRLLKLLELLKLRLLMCGELRMRSGVQQRRCGDHGRVGWDGQMRRRRQTGDGLGLFQGQKGGQKQPSSEPIMRGKRKFESIQITKHDTKSMKVKIRENRSSE